MAVPAWITGKVAQLVLVAVIAAAAAFFIGKAMDWRRTALANTGTVEQQAGKITATDGMVQDGAAADTAKADDETAVAGGRQTYTDTMERAQREDPVLADRASRPVPARVRDAARARRLARERSSSDEGERRAPPGAPAPAQR